MYGRGSVAGLEAQQAHMHILKDNFNVTLPRMLQRRNAVSAESARPGDIEDSKFVLQNFPKSQAQRSRIQEILSGIVLFQGVPDKIMKDLVGGFYETKFNNGDKIIVQGDVIADRFFLLESGQCDIFIQKGNADPFKVHTVLPGGFFGELALLYNAPRAATVISNGESRLWALDRGTFKNCMARASKSEDAATSAHASTTDKPAAPMFRRGSVILAEEQVQKVVEAKSNKLSTQHIPAWSQVIQAKITGTSASPRFIDFLLKYAYPDINLYKIASMDPHNTDTLLYPDAEPKKVIFLPACTLLPTGSRNCVELSGPHLDGVVTLRFADQRDTSIMLDIFKKSSSYFKSAQEAFKDVRYVAAGGKAADIQRAVDWVEPAEIYGVGLGLGISQNGKSISVRNIAPGSPAALCDTPIDVHDHLLRVDGVVVKHSCATLDDVAKLIRGVRGSTVRLELRRSRGPHAKSTYVVVLRRGPCVDADAAAAAAALQSPAAGEAAAADDEFFDEDDAARLQEDADDVGEGFDDEGEGLDEYDGLSRESGGASASDGASAQEREIAMLKHQLDLLKPADASLTVQKSYASTLKQMPALPYSLPGLPKSSSDLFENAASAASEHSHKSYSAALSSAAHAQISYIERMESATSKLTWSPSSWRPPASAHSPHTYSPPIPLTSPSQPSPRAQVLVKQPAPKTLPTNMGFTLSAAAGHYVVHSIEPNAPLSVQQLVCVGDELACIDGEAVASASMDDVQAVLRRSSACGWVAWGFVLACAFK